MRVSEGAYEFQKNVLVLIKFVTSIVKFFAAFTIFSNIFYRHFYFSCFLVVSIDWPYLFSLISIFQILIFLLYSHSSEKISRGLWFNTHFLKPLPEICDASKCL